METKLVFTGDVGFTKHYRNKYNDAELISPELISFLHDADCGVFNVEGALYRPSETGDYLHSSDPDSVGLLKRLHANVWNLANNHIFDAGAEGCANTMALARSCGFQTVGAGMNLREATRPVFLPGAGGIGLFGACKQNYQCRCAEENEPGCLTTSRPDRIREVAQTIKKTCRWCVMIAHDGREFCDVPLSDIREKYRSFLEAGVDIIVAHHPHVPQNYERVGEKMIFYSLGNFIFDTDYQRVQPHTDGGVLLKLFFTEESFRFEAVGTKIDRANGHVSQAPLPAVFTALTEKDYAAVMPKVCARFIEHIKKRQIFKEPETFSAYTEREWEEFWAKEDEKYGGFWECVALAKQYDGAPLGDAYRALEAYLI